MARGAVLSLFSLIRLGDAGRFQFGDADEFNFGDADRFQLSARACENGSQVQQKARQRLLPREVEAGVWWGYRRQPLGPLAPQPASTFRFIPEKRSHKRLGADGFCPLIKLQFLIFSSPNRPTS